MSILNDNTIQLVKTPPKEFYLNRTVSIIRSLTKSTFDQLVKTQRNGIEELWENPNATPQEIIDALGDDAIKVFQFHGALTQLITAISEIDNVKVDLKTPSNAFTIDKSGKIKVSDQPYVP